MNISRRTLLRGSLGAAGLTLLGLGRKSAIAGVPPKRRVLLVVSEGGLRTTMAFNASSRPELNPYGRVTVGDVKLGNIFTNDPTTSYAAPSWAAAGGVVPDIVQIAPKLTVVGAADHAPDGSYRNGDHWSDAAFMGTGYANKSGPGLATVCNRYLTTADTPLPACVVGEPFAVGAPLVHAAGEWKQFVPISLDAASMPSGAAGDPEGLGSRLEDAVDLQTQVGRRNLARGHLETYVSTKLAMRRYGPTLASRATNLLDPENLGEAVAGVTNQMLLEAIRGQNAGTDVQLMGNFALALRLLQLGSPFVVVLFGGGGFDTHSYEKYYVELLYPRLARALAGIDFALSNMEDPAGGGGSMRDSTLVVTVSEFGRSAGLPDGYATQNATHHGPQPDDPECPSWRYQAHVLLGGKNQPGVLFPTGEDNIPTGDVLPTQELLATIAGWAGVPDEVIKERWVEGTGFRPAAQVGALREVLP